MQIVNSIFLTIAHCQQSPKNIYRYIILYKLHFFTKSQLGVLVFGEFPGNASYADDHHGKIQPQDHEMSIDPGPHPRHVLWGCSKLYAHIMYPGYSGFKSSQIFSNLAQTFHSVITLTISLSKLFHLCLLQFRGRCLPKFGFWP